MPSGAYPYACVRPVQSKTVSMRPAALYVNVTLRFIPSVTERSFLVALFGSFARDEGREDSDVDLLVEFSRPIGLFEFVRMQRQLGELLGHRVDLVTPAALKPQLRDRILREAVVAA